MSGAGYLKGRVLPGCANEASSQMKCRGGRQMTRSAAMFAGFVAVSLTVPGAMAAATPATRPTRISQGYAGSLPWTLTVSTRNISAGTTHVPGLCVTFLWAWGPGQAIGNGFPTCIAPAIGKGDAAGHRLDVRPGRRRLPRRRALWVRQHRDPRARCARRPGGPEGPGHPD